MNKLKKALIVGVCFVLLGLIGFIPSLFWSVPSFEKDVNHARLHAREKRGEGILIYDSNNEVKKINIGSISTNGIRVCMKNSSDENIKVVKYDKMFDKLNLDVNLSDDGVLTLKGDSQFYANIFDKKMLSIKEIYNTIVDLIATSYREPMIEVYLPNKVDIEVNSNNYTYLNVKNKEVLGEDVNFLATAGRLKLPKYNNLKTLNIKSKSAIELDLRELMNIENIDINASYLRIYSYGSYREYNIDNLPSNLNVTAKEMYVESYFPIAKNAYLDVENCVKVKMDFDKFNVNSKIQLNNKEEVMCSNKSLKGENRCDFKKDYISLPFEDGEYEGKICDGQEGNFNLNIVAKRLKLKNYDKDRISYEIGH